MNFGSKTMLAMPCAVSIILLSIRSPWLCIALVLVLPFLCVMLIGLSSPQRGQQLDPTGRWYFYFVVQTWAMIWIGFLVMALAAALFPSLQHQLEDLTSGPKNYKQRVSQVVDGSLILTAEQ